MSDSIREQIGIALKSRLETILVSNDYNFDSGLSVYRARNNFDEEDLPALTFWLNSDLNDKTYSSNTRVMSVDIESFLLSDESDNDSQINKLLADIQLCMGTNTVEFNGLIEGLKETISEPAYPDSGSEVISASVTYEITYKTKQNNPYLSP